MLIAMNGRTAHLLQATAAGASLLALAVFGYEPITFALSSIAALAVAVPLTLTKFRAPRARL